MPYQTSPPESAPKLYLFTAKWSEAKSRGEPSQRVWKQEGCATNRDFTRFDCLCKKGSIIWCHRMPKGKWECPMRKCKKEYEFELSYIDGTETPKNGNTSERLASLTETVANLVTTIKAIPGDREASPQNPQQIFVEGEEHDRVLVAFNEALNMKLNPIHSAIQQLSTAISQPPEVSRNDIDDLQLDISSLREAVSAIKERNAHSETPRRAPGRPRDERNGVGVPERIPGNFDFHLFLCTCKKQTLQYPLRPPPYRTRRDAGVCTCTSCGKVWEMNYEDNTLIFQPGTYASGANN